MTRQDIKDRAIMAGHHVARAPDYLLERLSKINTTNLRVVFTMFIIGMTTRRYLTATDGWVPSSEWLIFLLGMITGDVVQWTKKRRTEWGPDNPAPVRPANRPSRDVTPPPGEEP